MKEVKKKVGVWRNERMEERTERRRKKKERKEETEQPGKKEGKKETKKKKRSQFLHFNLPATTHVTSERKKKKKKKKTRKKVSETTFIQCVCKYFLYYLGVNWLYKARRLSTIEVLFLHLAK